MEPKLTIELIPATCFYSNVRSNLPAKDWDRLRKLSYANANHTCEICGDNGKNQGYKHAVECHEIWDYNKETQTQTLIDLISLCPRCHQVKHIGRAMAMGRQADAFAHLEKVNEWNHKEVVNYLVKCFIEHKENSKIHWKLDIQVLHDKYGVNKLKVSSAEKNRKTNKPQWKKKKVYKRKK